jgi:hypothetical protein
MIVGFAVFITIVFVSLFMLNFFSMSICFVFDSRS